MFFKEKKEKNIFSSNFTLGEIHDGLTYRLGVGNCASFCVISQAKECDTLPLVSWDTPQQRTLFFQVSVMNMLLMPIL